ncbi:MAG: GNAT family N-acetyltransferase, partial [Paludibacter sp.]
RLATIKDSNKIYELYKEVSKTTGGIARTNNEITEDYIYTFTTKAMNTGLQFVVDNIQEGTIVGEIHCYKLEPKVFSHIFSDLTIVIHPSFQGYGLGNELFKTLLNTVKYELKDILRIELIVRESNKKAILFYEHLGFKKEGKLLNRIRSGKENFEADIPMAWMNENFVP